MWLKGEGGLGVYKVVHLEAGSEYTFQQIHLFSEDITSISAVMSQTVCTVLATISNRILEDSKQTQLKMGAMLDSQEG